MDLVIDANILFAAVIKNSITAELLVNKTIHLIAPEFLLKEFKKYEGVILKKTKRTAEEFVEILEIFNEVITFIPETEINIFIKQARKLCPDPKDAPYFAVALARKVPIWSNDKKLKEQDSVRVYSTSEILKYLLNSGDA